MITLVVSALLFGVILGQFFKVLALVLSDVLLVLIVLAASAYSSDGPASIGLKLAVLITSNAVGYALGQSVFHIADLLHWLRTQRTTPVKSRRV